MADPDKVELVRVVLSASATFSAVLLALLTLFIALKQTGRLNEMGDLGLRPYVLASIMMVFLICMALATSMAAFFYLLGHSQLYGLVIWLFPMTLIAVFIGSIMALTFSK